MDPAEHSIYAPMSERDRVEAWRLQALVDAGYPIPVAEQLANRDDVDLHQAVELVEAGCPPRLAGDILL